METARASTKTAKSTIVHQGYAQLAMPALPLTPKITVPVSSSILRIPIARSNPTPQAASNAIAGTTMSPKH
jgi:N-glycosylase/DNA lyase